MNKFNWTSSTPVTANNLNSMQDTLNNNIKPIVLWENSNPNTSMNAQNITLSTDDYDYLEVFYIDYALNGYKNMMSQKAPKGSNLLLMCSIRTESDNKMYLRQREIKWSSNTILAVKDSYGIEVGVSKSPDKYNQVNIPQKIIGYKYS